MIENSILIMAELFVTIMQRAFAENTLKTRGRSHGVQLAAWGFYFVAANYVTHRITTNVWGNISIALVSFFLLMYFLYADSTRSLIFVTVFIYISGMCAEFLTSYGYRLVAKEKLGAIGFGMEPYYLLIISRLVWSCIMKAALLTVKQNRKMEPSIRDWIEAFFVPAGSMLIMAGVFFGKNIRPEITSFFTTLILLTINIFTYYLYENVKASSEKKAAEKILREQCSYYMRQCEESQAMWEKFRTFRHDIKQKYMYEQMLLERKEYVKLEGHYKETLGFLTEKRKAASSGNMYFDSIVNYKAQVAEKDGIALRADIIVPQDANMDGESICVLLGNLLDNAIEAAKETEPEGRYVDLRIKAQGSSLFMKIENPYRTPRIKQGNRYVTTKENKKEHGIGLKIVEELVEKYQGEMELTEGNHIFTVTLLLYSVFPGDEG